MYEVQKNFRVYSGNSDARGGNGLRFARATADDDGGDDRCGDDRRRYDGGCGHDGGRDDD